METISLPERKLDLCIKQFTQFYDLLMKNAPEGYMPWFFPCAKNGKNPDARAILNINSESKGSWHHESARLGKEEAIKLIESGYNIGISARESDPLIIIDVDEEEYIKQVPKDTLTVTSRKIAGKHAFCWDDDGSAKINLPTDYGEIRSSNQYVLACGSYVQFNLSSEKEVEAYNKLPVYAKINKHLGHYTLDNRVSPRKINFEGLPQFFKDKEKENIDTESNIKQREEKKNYNGKEGKYTELFNLKVSDIVGLIPSGKRLGHPLHESDTDSNFSLSKDGSIGHCWRHMVSLNAVQYLCVKSGYSKCEDAGTPHKGRGLSKIKGDNSALKVAYDEALKMKLINEYSTLSNLQGKIGAMLDKKELARQIMKVQPCYYDKSRTWWLWSRNETKWERVDETDILNAIEKEAQVNTINSKEKSEMIEALKQVSRLNKPEDIKPTWIQFKNKIVDIETGEEFDASPKYFVTNPIPWDMEQKEFATPVMDRIFAEWVGKDNVEMLYEILSYCIIPDYPIHRIFCFIGGGMNGKSCFLNLLRKFIGHDNCCSTELDTLLASRFEVTRLHKKLVCQMGETNFNEMSKTSTLKKLSGGDLIGFEYKNKDPFEEINYAKIIIATNNLPTTTDKTVGFYRRWMIIDFPNQFTEAKDILEEIPDKEYESLALRTVVTLRGLLKNRQFTNEGSVEDRMKRYESHSNFLRQFLNEFVDEDDINSYITKADFYKKFIEWCKENRHREMGDQTLSKAMKTENIDIGKKFFGWMFDGNGGQARVWLGIKWKE